MPSIVDAFIVELGLDPSQFEKEQKTIAGRLAGLRQRTQQGAKQAEDNLKAIADGFESLGRKALAFIGSIVSIRSLVSFSIDIVQTNRLLGIMADVTGENIEGLSKLKNAFDRMGGSGEGLLKIINEWDREIKQGSIGTLDASQSKLFTLLSELATPAGGGINVSAYDSQGKLRKRIDIMADIIKGLGNFKKLSTAQIAILQKAGFDDANIRFISEHGDEIRKILEEQENILKVTEEQRKATDELNMRWQTLSQRLQAIGLGGLTIFADALEKVTSAMTKMFRAITNTVTDPNSVFYHPRLSRMMSEDKAKERTIQGYRRSVEDKEKAASGPAPQGSSGGSAGITAPAGTPIHRTGMETVTTSTGRKFQVDARYARNFQGFIDDYEKAGGVIGPESGTLGHRPHNPSGHPIGAAIDINQIGYGIRGRGGKTLPPDVEDALAEKWGLVSGNKWRRPDTGHFGIRSPEAAREALTAQGITQQQQQQASKGASGGWSVPLTAVPFMNFKPMSLRPPSITNTTKTDISNLTVNSQAKDAPAIAADIAAELKRQMKADLPSQQFINARTPQEADAAMARSNQAAQ